MAEPVFDTQKAVRQLRDEAGFEEKAAEAMVRVIADAMQSVATKRDLDDLRRDVDTKIDGLDKKIDGVEERLNARMDRLEEGMTAFEERVMGAIASGQRDLLKVMLYTTAGAMTGLTAIFSVISKVF